MSTSPPRFAVLFRTHVWDGFVARQYERLKQRIDRGDLYILLDATNGAVVPDGLPVVSHTDASIRNLKLAPAGGGNMLWYNGDYPLYFFQEMHPDYDYYLMTEYDVFFNTDLDTLVERAAQAGADLVSLTKGEPVSNWAHAESCHDVYPPDVVQKRLICFAVFSRAAVVHLFKKRRALSAEIHAGTIRRWPFCESFIPTELATSGFRLMELSELGTTTRYDWWPPVLEDDLPDHAGDSFIHPVLDPPRYVDSALRIWRLSELFNPRSALHRRLNRVSIWVYLPRLVGVLRTRMGRAIRRRFALAV